MKASVELSGLDLPDGLEPKYDVMTKQELDADLCVKGKEYQCKNYLTFSPPMSNRIVLSSSLHPETSIKDRAIIFHENMKYLLFVNNKLNPSQSCEKAYALEARIFKLQMKYMAYEIARNETKEKLSPEDILKVDKGSYVTWCDPTAKEPDPQPPKFKRYGDAPQTDVNYKL